LESGQRSSRPYWGEVDEEALGVGCFRYSGGCFSCTGPGRGDGGFSDRAWPDDGFRGWTYTRGCLLHELDRLWGALDVAGYHDRRGGCGRHLVDTVAPLWREPCD